MLVVSMLDVLDAPGLTAEGLRLVHDLAAARNNLLDECEGATSVLCSDFGPLEIAEVYGAEYQKRMLKACAKL